MTRRKRDTRSFLVAPLLVGWLTSHQGDAQDLGAVIDLYEAGDFASALDGFVVLATEGDATAQHYLARMYFNGEGVPQDDAEAERLSRLAAEQGHAGAQFKLGTMYSDGRSVAQNDVEAAKWYRRVAEQGHALVQFVLGWMRWSAKGVPQDFVSAYAWISVSSANDPSLTRAKKLRDMLAEPMTKAQIVEAQELFVEYWNHHVVAFQ